MIPDDSEIDPILLARYFTGECSRAEAVAFERWVALRPERQALVAELRNVWAMGEARLGVPIDTKTAWRRITSQLDSYRDTSARPALRIERGGGEPLRVLMPASTSARTIRRIAVAAGIAIAIAGGGMWSMFRGHAGASTEYAVATEHGGRRTVRLGDGTQVILGPMSRLRVMARGAAPPREVELDGEAFFQVAHDPHHPFRVHARGTEARVLGTEFTVRAYGDERSVQVAVRTGRVAVRSTTTVHPAIGNPVVTAGQRAVVIPGDSIRIDHLTESSAFAWTAGPIRFESTPFGEVAREMSRWVGLEIMVPGTLRSTKVTVSFPDLARDSVLARLARLAGGRMIVVRDGAAVLAQTDSLRKTDSLRSR